MRDLIAQPCESIAKRRGGYKFKWGRCNGTGQEGGAAPKCHGRNLDDDFIEQTLVVKLPNQVTAAYNPDVFVARSTLHRLMHRQYVTLHKSNIRAFDFGQFARTENPGGLFIGPTVGSGGCILGLLRENSLMRR